MISKHQFIRRATFSEHSLLQAGELAYLGSRIILNSGVLSTELIALNEDGHSKARLEEFGRPILLGPRRRRPLSWDVTNEAANGADRVSIQNVSISLREVEPFDIESSSAPHHLKLLAREAKTLKWFCVPARGRQLVISSQMLLERVLSPSARLAAVLLSPFRELAFRLHKEGDDVTALIDTAELGMASECNLLTRHGGRTMHADFLCFGYWAHLSNGFAYLDEVSAAIRGGTAIPPLNVDDQFPIKAPALRVGNTFFAQALSADIGTMRWPTNWSSLTLLGGSNKAGLVLHPKPDRSTLPLSERHITEQHLTRLECSRLLYELGWRKTLPRRDIAAAKKGLSPPSPRPRLRRVAQSCTF